MPRPANYVKDADNRPIVGLSYHKASGRYYLTHSKPRKYLGKDKAAAIAAHRQLTSSDPGTVELTQTLVRPRDRRQLPMDAYSFYAKVRELLLEDPADFASRVGIPALARLDLAGLHRAKITLDDCWRVYAGKKRKRDAHYVKNTQSQWGEFAKRVPKRLADITIDHVQAYHDYVWERGKQWSSTWINTRLSAVTTVLNHALKGGRDLGEIRRVLDLTACFERAKKPKNKPKPISKADFTKLYKAADDELRLAMLCMLNFVMTPKDLQDLKWDDIDLKAGTLVGWREKTDLPRIAVLWKRTANALQARKDKEGKVFRVIGDTHYRRFRRLAKELKLKVVPNQLKDGAYTAAVNAKVPLERCRALVGHATGMDEHYVLRQPKLVEDACEAIEKAYF